MAQKGNESEDLFYEKGVYFFFLSQPFPEATPHKKSLRKAIVPIVHRYLSQHLNSCPFFVPLMAECLSTTWLCLGLVSAISFLEGMILRVTFQHVKTSRPNCIFLWIISVVNSLLFQTQVCGSEPFISTIYFHLVLAIYPCHLSCCSFYVRFLAEPYSDCS